MYKVEELNKGMGPAYRMGEQLKDIKRLLDIYEAAAAGTSVAVTSHFPAGPASDRSKH